MSTPTGPVGLISNPTSGHNRDHFDSIRQRIAQSPAIHHRVTENLTDIPDALQELAARNVAVLAINGGDGTAAAILAALLQHTAFPDPPLIALLPGGTANMTAGDVGVRGSLRKAVGRFCDWSASDRRTGGKVVQRALLRVSTHKDKPPRYGMFLGGGAVIQGTRYAHRTVHSRGLRGDFSLALSTLRTVWGILRNDPAFNRHVTISVSLDGQVAVTYDTLILAISTLQRLSFGMRPFWGKGPGGARITLMEQGCSRFAKTFLSIIRGSPNGNAVPASGYQSYNARRINLSMEGSLNLDGELLHVAGDVDISTSPILEFLRL
ncbi:MAG: kinase [Halioglobus sp.]|nr:kinase [Halioglobus sp.]